jgi:alpha-L-arabinofuranosidase
VAHIDVLTGRPIGTVDPRIFGSVTEHLGRCVDGGVVKEGSPDGFRADVLAAVRDLGVTNVRWALGAAPGAEEPGRFGTGGFLSWCAVAAVEPVLSFDMDTGTLDEALAWVEYCNGSGDSHWARRRQADGHAQPFGVRYWGLGHQMHRRRTAAEYVTEASRWASALKRLDPGIRLISSGQTGMDDWDRDVIDGLARHVDMHGIRLYTGSADYWSNLLAPHYAERALSVAGALIDRARYLQHVEHEISVACDEWNVWYRTEDGRLEERYTLADALAVATWLNVFVRQSWTVRMANQARLVNALAPIVTSADGLFSQAIYHPFQLMAAASEQVAVDTYTDSGAHIHRDRPGDRWPYRVGDLGLFQRLDVAATADPGRSRLTLSVVNRDPRRSIRTRIRLFDATATGVMGVHEVTGDSPDAVNSFTRPDAISVRNAKREVDGEHVDIAFSPHSFTVLEMQLALPRAETRAAPPRPRAGS